MLSLSAQTTCNVIVVKMCQKCFKDDLDNDGNEEGEPDDVEDEEGGHEEVEDVVDWEHLEQLQRGIIYLDIIHVPDDYVIRNVRQTANKQKDNGVNCTYIRMCEQSHKSPLACCYRTQDRWHLEMLSTYETEFCFFEPVQLL